MVDEYKKIWTSDKDKYILLDFSENGLQIFNIISKTVLLIEDEKIDKLVKQQMILNRNRMIRGELVEYILAGRPIPVMIGTENGLLIFRCPDTGELISLAPDKRGEPEPNYRLVIKWSDSIPVNKQILLLKKLWPGISISTPELLKKARETNEYEFANYCWVGIARAICANAEKVGLNISMYPDE